MTTLTNPPLLEAIFEIRWGERSPGNFKYSSEEHSLLPGMLTSEAIKRGFGVTESLSHATGPGVMLPMQINHRFRRSAKTWPCLQLGLGVFTVNQTANGYDWDIFRNDIGEGFDIFRSVNPEALKNDRHDTTLILRYQDTFYPDEGMSAYQYIEKYLNITVALPSEYTSSELLSSDLKDVHFRFNTSTVKPQGSISVSLVSAIINGRPGLLMETIVESNAKKVLGEYSVETLLEWAESAHDLQRHAFKSLINKSSYSQ